MKHLVLYDFDGTLTTKDSFLAFIRFYKGTTNYLLGLFLLSPLISLYVLKILSAQRLKECFLTYYFKGDSEDFLMKKGDEFAQKIIPKMLKRNAYKVFMKHKRSGHEVCVVSASFSLWLKPWAQREGVNLISSSMVFNEGKATGKIEGKNCNGVEKAKRVLNEYQVNDYDRVIVYGNSGGDREMMKLRK